MSGAFALQLRSPNETMSVRDAARDGDAITIRVQLADIWDLVRIEAGEHTPVIVVKEAALRVLAPGFVSASDYVVKLNGLEVLDESVSLSYAGARNGSTFLLAFRRRRPVR
jgi:hypothetical protein